jgi:isocitrate lyase
MILISNHGYDLLPLKIIINFLYRILCLPDRTLERAFNMLRPAFRAVCRQRRGVVRLSSNAARAFATTTYRMSPLQPVSPPVSSSLPADSFQLLPEKSKTGEAEDALYDAQVQAVKDWWNTPRYEGIKRPYTAEDVVARRGALQQTYPSSLMARKLFNLFEERAREGKPVHTSAWPFSISSTIPEITTP